MLALDPNHPGALARRDEAWERARAFTAGMLNTAELTAKQPRINDAQRKSQVRSLRILLKLAPPGSTYDRAKELIKMFDNSIRHKGEHDSRGT